MVCNKLAQCDLTDGQEGQEEQRNNIASVGFLPFSRVIGTTTHWEIAVIDSGPYPFSHLQ